MSDPRVALATLAAATAMAASVGGLGERTRRQLLLEGLAFGDRGWAEALIAFEAAVDADPRGAGARLYDYAMGPGWPQAHHPWMDRADING